MPPPLLLALVEDDAEVRTLLRAYLNQQPELRCVLVADSVEALLAELPLLKQRLPQTAVLMQTVFDAAGRIYRALCAGASGYVLKNTPLAELKAAVLGVAQGGAPMSRAVAHKVLAHFKPTPSLQPDLLTAREREVVQAIVDGLGDKQVAQRRTSRPRRCAPTSSAFTASCRSAAAAS